MKERKIRAMAKDLAAEMFTCGTGERATRLVLVIEDVAGEQLKNLGGLCIQVVENRLFDGIKSAMDKEKGK